MISIVIPTYREAENIPVLVPRVTHALQDRPHEIIIVDDDSNDGIVEAVATLRKEQHVVRLVVIKECRGLSSAVLEGFREARGSVLVCMDADLSHPPEMLPRMVDMLERDEAEFVIGSRYVSAPRSSRARAVWNLMKPAASVTRSFMMIYIRA